jgi:rod shape-determining protein MreC
LSFRASLVLSLALSLALLFFGRAEASVFDKLRSAIETATSPVYEFVGPPIATARNMIGAVFHITDIYSENKRLRAENAELKAWQNKALLLEQKVERYEALLALPLDPNIEYRTGRIVDDPGGPFVRTFRVNLGHKDGIAEGEAVIGAGGLVGRIVSAGPRAARILLITDLNSRIPVMVGPGGVRGILVGRNDAAPAISYLPRDAQVAVGSKVFTSGNGGLLPPGIPVGEVTAVKGDHAVVKPVTRFNRISYVRVLEYASPDDGVPYSSDGPPILTDTGDEGSTAAPQAATHAKPAKAHAKPAPEGTSASVRLTSRGHEQ